MEGGNPLVPFGTETVSLIQRMGSQDENGRTQVGYGLHVLTGCSWRLTAQMTRSDNATSRSYAVTCRIPAGQVMPSVGDYLVLGVLEQTPQTTQQLQILIRAHRSHGAFCIASVADNARPGMPFPHYTAKGDML